MVASGILCPHRYWRVCSPGWLDAVRASLAESEAANAPTDWEALCVDALRQRIYGGLCRVLCVRWLGRRSRFWHPWCGVALRDTAGLRSHSEKRSRETRRTHGLQLQRLLAAVALREWLPFLFGEGHVPCILHPPGIGHHVIGEVYEVDEQSLANMDRLERLGEPGGYERVAIEVWNTDPFKSGTLTGFADVQLESQMPVGTLRTGPLAEYLPEHARHFRW